MKSLKIRPIGGLYFALLFVFAIALVVTAVIKNNDIYVAYAILVSCFQFYLYEKLKLSRFFFKRDDSAFEHASECIYAGCDDAPRYNIHLN